MIKNILDQKSLERLLSTGYFSLMPDLADTSPIYSLFLNLQMRTDTVP